MTSEIKDIPAPGGVASKAPVQMVWLNGALLAAAEARVSPFDHGLLVGDGAFETLQAYEGKLFAMRRHCERLQKAGAALGIEIPAREILEAGAEAVIRANGLTNARVRITVTGGPAPLGSEKGDEGATVVIAAAASPRWDRLAAVITVPYTRNERGALAGLKTTSYGENVIALADAKKRRASEAIFPNTRGELCEGTGSNIFLVRGGAVMTPPLSSGCLAGVTRGLVLELCAKERIPVSEVMLKMADLAEAEEAFLTSTTREVQAIGSVDGRAIAPEPGPITMRLAAAFTALVAEEIDP